jgi:anti-sigma B factor antagonist
MPHVPSQVELSHAFRLTVRRHGERALVTVSGDLDFATAGELDRALVTQVRSAGLVVLDLREIAFIDAGGLGVLLRAEANARLGGIGLWLMASECVRRMLVLSGVTTQFTYGDPSPH